MVRDTRQFLSLNSSFSCIDYIDIVPVYSSYAHMNKQDAINSAKKRGLGKGGGGWGKVLIKYFFQVFNMLYPS